MQFTKYSSLENHYQTGFIQKILFAGLTKTDVVWTAREKIHGANYSMWFDGTTFNSAKRSGFVGGGNFFSHEIVDKRYENCIRNMYDYLSGVNTIEQGDALCVYGELAGTMPTGSKVQQEVDYGDLDFYAFDIKINGKFIDDLEVEALCFDYSVRTAPLLAIGSFDELFKINNEFQSCVFQTVGATEFELIYEGDNVSEGYVLKPNVTVYFDNGDRVAIKSKNEKFSEKKKAGKIRNAKTKDIDVVLCESDQSLVELLETFNTDNRLRNVISKVGDVTQKDFGKLLGLMVQDIYEDFEKERGPQLALDSHLVARVFRAMVSQTIGKNFGPIIAGSF